MKNKWIVLAYHYDKEEISIFATFSNRDNALQVKKSLNKKQKNNRKVWYFVERIKSKKFED